MPIHPHTWPRLLDAIYDINSAASHSSFSEAVVAGLGRVIASDVAVFHVLDPAKQRILTHMVPPAPYTAEEVAYYTAHSGDHPLGAHYLRHPDAGALRVSDVIDGEEWLASDYYRHCQQRLGLVHSVVLPVRIDQSIVVALSFSRREPDFTREDCEVLDAFAPHLRLA